MAKNPKFAEAVVSIQAYTLRRGEPAHILMRDPSRPDGYQWVGGHYDAHGSLTDAAKDSFEKETGLKVEITGLHQIVYSRTQRSNRWIANHAFGGIVHSLDDRAEPDKSFTESPDYEIALFDSHSLGNGSPRKLIIFAGSPYAGEFKWSTTDGEYLAQVARRRCFSSLLKRRWYAQIPIVEVPGGAERNAYASSGLEIGSAIIPHNYKGKDGFVLPINQDSPGKPALFGGKIEHLRSRESTNIDSISGIISEAMEEGNFALKPLSIVGAAMTPIQSGYWNEYNSIVNCCLLAEAMNPCHLDEILENPQKHITEKDKIKDIIFLTSDELEQVARADGMRSPDMSRLVLRYFDQGPNDRPNLEHIRVLSTNTRLAPLTDFSNPDTVIRKINN